jgi:hypothetical protein
MPRQRSSAEASTTEKVTDMEWLLMDLIFVANLARINDDVFLTAWHRLHFPMVPG